MTGVQTCALPISLKNYCDQIDIDFRALWNSKDTEIHHFLGKDILYFHALFWPSILKVANYKLPEYLHIHGYLTINGQKMSKSRGTFITARQFINSTISPELFRYYIATKLNNKIEDIDFNLDDFITKVNSDLVGKYVNIIARTSSFLTQFFNNTTQMADETLLNSILLNNIKIQKQQIANYYNNKEYAKLTKLIMSLVDEINIFIDDFKPWLVAKELKNLTLTQDNENYIQNLNNLHQFCSIIINAFYYIAIYLKPIIPDIIANIEQLLNIKNLSWYNLDNILSQHTINNYTHLLKRIDTKMTQNLLNTDGVSESILNTGADAITNNNSQINAIADIINIDDFSKIDLRVATIIAAQHVDGADKLLQLTVDLGDHTRNIFAGIKACYKPEDLIGRHTVVVANLASRKMKFGVSEGMVLAASFDNKDSGIFLLSPDSGACAGMRIR